MFLASTLRRERRARWSKRSRKKLKEKEAGFLPPIRSRNSLPPPPFSLRNVIRVIGPGTILQGTSIGSGEWLLGPATIVITIAEAANWLLLGAFAAYSGAGGMGNCFISNWMRDKGYAMGSTVGYIPSAVGGKAIKLSPIGNILEPNEKNLSRWRIWMKYLAVDQYVVWGLGCIVGMFLCPNFAAAIVPAGTKITGLTTGAYQAKYLMEHTGYQIFWFQPSATDSGSSFPPSWEIWTVSSA